MASYNKKTECAVVDPCDFICAHECTCDELDCPCDTCVDIPDDCTELSDYSISIGKDGTKITDFAVDGTTAISGDILLPDDLAVLEAELQAAFGVGQVTVTENGSGGAQIDIVGACSKPTVIKGITPTGASPPDPIFSLFAIAGFTATNVVPVEPAPPCPHILPGPTPIVRCL